MKKHYRPMEALAALYRRQEHPAALLYMRCITANAENKIKHEAIFLSHVAEWKRMDINCVKASVIGAVVPYKQMLRHFAVPETLKEAIRKEATRSTVNSPTLGYLLLQNPSGSQILELLIRLDARVVLSRLSERGSISTRTIKITTFYTPEGSCDIRTGEIPSHIIIPAI